MELPRTGEWQSRIRQEGGVWGITLIVQSLHLADSLGAGRSPEQTLRAQPCRKKRLDTSVPRTLACLRFCESPVCGINLPWPQVRFSSHPMSHLNLSP